MYLLKHMIVLFIGIFLSKFAYENKVILINNLSILTFFKLPFLKVLDTNCDNIKYHEYSKSSQFNIDKHCFDLNGNIFVYDSNHNDSYTEYILKKYGNLRCPVLIKHPFNDDKCYSKIIDYSKKNPAFKIRVKENNITLLKNNKIFVGEIIKEKNTKKYEIHDFLELISKNDSLLFTSFENSFANNDYMNFYGSDLTYLNSKFTNTFISNYNESFITTPMHNAMVESYAYQCEGTKIWQMMTPNDVKYIYRLLYTYGIIKNCNDRNDIIKLIFNVTTTKDTLFYFPPFWAHSVYTEKGLSILFNLRGFNVKKIFKSNFLLGLNTMSSIIYHSLFFINYDPDELFYYFSTGNKPKLTDHSIKPTLWND
jgi:hypothetical protein